MFNSTTTTTTNGTSSKLSPPLSFTTPALPIISLASFLPSSSLSPSTRQSTANDLISACHEHGFVYITDHGIPQSLLDQAFSVSKSFFDLPLDKKMLAPHPEGWAVHRGYSHPGLEKVSDALGGGDGGGHKDEEVKEKLRVIQDFKESYEIGHSKNPDQPNVFPPPDTLPDFEPFMLSFYNTLFTIPTTAILRALGLGLLGPDHEDKLLNYHSGKYNQLRLLHYPPVRVDDLVSYTDNNNSNNDSTNGNTNPNQLKYARMPAHTDWSVLTLLFQDSTGGLQIQSSDSSFIDVPPIPGTLVLNIGDLLQRWSNDYLRSTSHRVSIPFDISDDKVDMKENGEKWLRSRYSIPYFVTTDPDVTIECLVDTSEKEGVGKSQKYEPITQRQYNAMRASMQY